MIIFLFCFLPFFPPFSSEVVLDTGDLDVLMVTTFFYFFFWLFVQMGTRDPCSAIEHFDGYGPYRRMSSTPLN
jgi:hypothetical protein